MADVTYLEALRQGLWEEMERDPRVFILGEDVGAYGGAFKVTEGFAKKFGEARVIDTPISEAAIVGAAAGRPTWACAPWRRCSSSTSSPAPTTCSPTTSPPRATAPVSPPRSWCEAPAAATCAVARSIRRTRKQPSSTLRA